VHAHRLKLRALQVGPFDVNLRRELRFRLLQLCAQSFTFQLKRSRV
jgi:hypothetical protein